MTHAMPNESKEYRTARNQLLEQKIELRRQIEAVANARRELPPGGELREDYEFETLDDQGATATIRFSELFAPRKDSLVVYSFMYGPSWESACPSCTSILDGLDGQVVHLEPRINLAVVAKAPLQKILDHARDRGWTRLRLLSSLNNSYNQDYLAQPGSDDDQVPMVNVFKKSGDVIRHT